MSEEPTEPRYPKPSVLLLDMSNDCYDALLKAGFNVVQDTFGQPYVVEPSDRLFAVDYIEPPIAEQDILIVNTEAPPPGETPAAKGSAVGAIHCWQSAQYGLIDPRLIAMHHVNEQFDHIISHGGIAIVLLSHKTERRIDVGAMNASGKVDLIRGAGGAVFSNYSFSKIFGNVCVKNLTEGIETNFTGSLGELLSRGAADARYKVEIESFYSDDEYWQPLAENKFGTVVAGMYQADDSCFLFLPQMPNLHLILPELLQTYCTKWRPKLFPFHEGLNWVHDDTYEIPEVVRLNKLIEDVQLEAEKKTSELNEQVELAKKQNSHWYTLLNGTGDELVQAVIHGLGELGFQDVRDIDQESPDKKEEDIQIHDSDPVLIVDVKGIRGCPDDGESGQAAKHAHIRLRDFHKREIRSDVQPLMIINHERNLAPLERTQNPYRTELVQNAEETDAGLMTTWDMFRLLRNKERLNWSDKQATPVFYRTGRVEPIPDHYTEFGTIVNVWKKNNAIGVVTLCPISKGDRVAVEGDVLFEEFTADSLQVNGKDVDSAETGSECGIVCSVGCATFRKGMRVFMVAE